MKRILTSYVGTVRGLRSHLAAQIYPGKMGWGEVLDYIGVGWRPTEQEPTMLMDKESAIEGFN